MWRWLKESHSGQVTQDPGWERNSQRKSRGLRHHPHSPTPPSAPQRLKQWRPALNLHVYHLAWTLSFALRTTPTHQSDDQLDPRSPEQVQICVEYRSVCARVYVIDAYGRVVWSITTSLCPVTTAISVYVKLDL